MIQATEILVGTLSNGIEYINPVTQEKSVTPSLVPQEVIPDQDYTGLSKVIVNEVTNEIDRNIKSENIKNGVEILGVTGTLEDGYKVNVIDNTLIFSKGVIVKESELII